MWVAHEHIQSGGVYRLVAVSGAEALGESVDACNRGSVVAFPASHLYNQHYVVPAIVAQVGNELIPLRGLDRFVERRKQ